MKRLLLLMILSCFTAVGLAQDVYYWAGGTTATSFTGTNWKKDNVGANVARSATTDILVFDGVTVAFNSGGATIGRLQLQNGADVSFSRANANTFGTSTLNLTGADELVLSVSGNSRLRLIDGAGGAFVLTLAANKRATIVDSEIYVLGAAWVSPSTGAQRIQVATSGAFVFSGTSKCFTNVANTYPFSASTNSGASSSANHAVVFQTGTSLVFQGGRNPFGEHASNFVVEMKDGSTFIAENNTAVAVLKDRWMKNVTIRNNVNISMTSENFNNIDDLTIENGSTFLVRGTGPSPISGNIVNNGALGVASSGSSNLIMIGRQPQSISGTGSFDLGAFSVAADADVTLHSSIKLTGTLISYIYGKLNLQNNQVIINASGSTVGRFQLRASANAATTGASMAAGSNLILFLNVSDYDALPVAPGMLITGAGIEANTYVINTSSSGTITLSKPALSSGDGSVIVFANSPTLSTSNANGIDGGFDFNLAGSLTLSTGTNFIFNGTTLTPFSSASNNALGDVTFNASASTNKTPVTINGKLALNNSKLTVSEGHILTMAPMATFDGSFGSDAYISTASNTSSTTVGRIRLTDLATSKLIPIGTATHYTPVTLNPTSTSTFDINVFAGTTTDATPNGTTLTAAQKSRMVDATWNIQRTSGSGNVEVVLGWDNALAGTDFANFSNAQIGIASYNGAAFGAFSGSGNAAANTATITTGTFSPFVVGEANTTLPLKLISFIPKQVLNSVKLEWKTTDEVNLKNYVLQHKTSNGFQDIYTVAANNKLGIFNYNYTHLNPVAGVNYYRLVGVDLDGTIHESEIKSIRVSLGSEVAVYPNPVNQRNITVSGVVKGDVIRILNIQGQVLVSREANGSQIEEIDVQHIQTGTYILSIENGGKITNTKKVIKI